MGVGEEKEGLGRALAMELLYRYGGMNQREIGGLLGVDYSSVSVGRKRLREAVEKDKRVERLSEEITTLLCQD
jgi:DNA-binding MarR family transcriptional regulator